MKITLSKKYLNHTAGETIEVTDKRGGYLLRVGVGEKEVKKEPKQKTVSKFKEPYSKSEEVTKGIVHRKTPEEADTEIKALNKFK